MNDDNEPNPITGDIIPPSPADTPDNTDTVDNEAAHGRSSTSQHTTPIMSHMESMPPFSYTPQKTSGLFGASCNLVNSIVGAGIIGIPYALRQSGLVAGIFLLMLVSWLTDKSLRVIVDAAKCHPKLQHLHVRTFEDLMSYPFGRSGTVFILFNMFIMAYGAMVAYLLIIKDTIPTVLGLANGMEGGIEREVILIVTSLIVMVPLSMQRDMASLAFTSLLSVTADVILVGFIVAYSPVQESLEAVGGGVGEFLANDVVKPTLFIGLGILSTAMACQHSCFIVNESLHNATRRRWALVTGSSISLACILCAILGITGYLGFLEETQGDVLNNFEPGSVAANAARVLLAITMFFTYPMESFVGRHVLVALIHGGDMEGDGERHEGCLERFDRCMLNRRERMTLGLYCMTLLPALIFDDLGPVLSITGSLGGSCIAYIAPGMAYLGVNGDAFLAYAYEKLGQTTQKLNRSDVELPVAGNANLMRTQTSTRGTRDDNLELPVEGQHLDMDILAPPPGCKPLWWYIMGFPIWCAIAQTGSTGMKTKLGEMDQADPQTNFRQYQGPDSREHDTEVVYPSGGEFCVAIFFIVFGAIAAVAGLGTNIYVQLHNVGVIA